MNIALFGGSFDPIHNGHLSLARGAAEALRLDRVILMPTAQPPHKLKKTATDGAARLAMCRLAVGDDPLFEVSELELQKGGASFTVDTLETLCAARPRDTWFLLTGADMFLTLASWKNFERIAQLAVLCTVPRDDISAARLRAYADTLKARGARCCVCELPLTPVSSTQIRAAAAAGEPLDGLVPPAVGAYILQNGLYREGETVMDRDEQFKQIIRRRLKPERYAHSLAVADEAKRLARLYGADEQKAYTAGLLHDIMKNTDQEAQLQILKDFDILLDTVERQSPKLWHARVGAVFIERVLGVEDEEIVTAVRYHTTARAGMSLLEKVLYLADFTSADRDYDDVDVMRRLVDENMDRAMIYALRYTIAELTQRERPVHPDTFGAYNEWILKKGC
ncbi:MAG: nicotinate-nucleotide adenylyltransferase [Acutalibacteraceae bacterium]